MRNLVFQAQIITFLFLGMLLFSCKKEETLVKPIDNNEIIYTEIVDKWAVNKQNTTEQSSVAIKQWDDFISLKKELNQKPSTSLGAIKQKTILISKKIKKLQTSIPPLFDTPETKSRLAVLLSKAKMLETQVYLDYIKPTVITEYSISVVEDFNLLEAQLERIIVKNQIKFEEGELEMRQQLQSKK